MQEDQITPLYQDLATLEEMPAEAAAWSAMQDKNKELKQSRFIHYSMVDMGGIFIQFQQLLQTHHPELLSSNKNLTDHNCQILHDYIGQLQRIYVESVHSYRC